MHNTAIWTPYTPSIKCWVPLSFFPSTSSPSVLASPRICQRSCHVPSAGTVFNPMSRENRHDATNNGLMVCSLVLLLSPSEKTQSEIEFFWKIRTRISWNVRKCNWFTSDVSHTISQNSKVTLSSLKEPSCYFFLKTHQQKRRKQQSNFPNQKCSTTNGKSFYPPGSQLVNCPQAKQKLQLILHKSLTELPSWKQHPPPLSYNTLWQQVLQSGMKTSLGHSTCPSSCLLIRANLSDKTNSLDQWLLTLLSKILPSLFHN